MVNCRAYYGMQNTTEGATIEKFLDWKIAYGWMTNPNEIRYITFEDHCVYANPGNNELLMTNLDINEPWEPMKWAYFANFCPSEYVMGACFPEPCNYKMQPYPGSLKVNVVSKCHRIFWPKGKTVPILIDPEGA